MSEPAFSPSAGQRTAVLGGGCFWCLEGVLRDLDGVTEILSGYAGGSVALPSYEQVCTGRTGHAEVVRITYDTGALSYADLLRVFFTIHDPTTPNRQGADVGTQYRSVIFTTSDQERETAEAVTGEINAAGIWTLRSSPRSARCRRSIRPRPSTTTISRCIPAPATAAW